MRDDACRISVVGSSHSAKSTYLIWTVAWHQLGNLGCLMTVCWIHSFSKNLHIIRGSLGSVLHACICRQNSWINWSLVLPPFQDFLNHYEDLHDYSGNHPFPTRNASGVGKACIYIYMSCKTSNMFPTIGISDITLFNWARIPLPYGTTVPQPFKFYFQWEEKDP